MEQGNQFQWLGVEICSPLILPLFSCPVLSYLAYKTRYLRDESHTNTRPSTSTAGQASPDKNFYVKISERLKSNFFSFVPARRPPRPTILNPGPIPA